MSSYPFGQSFDDHDFNHSADLDWVYRGESMPGDRLEPGHPRLEQGLAVRVDGHPASRCGSRKAVPDPG